MTTLVVGGLSVAVGGTEILRGIDLEIRSGEVHAVGAVVGKVTIPTLNVNSESRRGDPARLCAPVV